jgi:hypothetical protein
VNKSINKLVDFQNLVYSNDSDIVAVPETWLNCNVLDTEILCDDYIIYRRDRNNNNITDNTVKKRGGGVLLAIKKTLNSSQVHISEKQEILAIEIIPPKHSKVLIVLSYRPPSMNVSEYVNELHTFFIWLL